MKAEPARAGLEGSFGCRLVGFGTWRALVLLVRGWVPQQCGVWFPGPVIVAAEKAVTGFGPTANAASAVFVRFHSFGSGFLAAVQRGACFRVCAERVSVFVSSVTSPGRKGRRWKAVAPAAAVLFRQTFCWVALLKKSARSSDSSDTQAHDPSRIGRVVRSGRRLEELFFAVFAVHGLLRQAAVGIGQSSLEVQPVWEV